MKTEVEKEKESNQPSPSSKILYQKENSLLNMVAVPYFGVYSNNYTFCMPCNVLHSEQISNEIFSQFPENLQKHFIEFQKNYNVDLDYFLVTLDATFMCGKYAQSESGFLRVNFVPHPYIFYDVSSLNQDHKTNIFTAIFSEESSSNYLKETNEYDGLRINPAKLICDENKKEIILHRSGDNFPALSPNNCSILINTNKVFFTLYNMTLITYKNKIVKCMVAQYNFFLYNDIKLFSPILNTLNNFCNEALADVLVNLSGQSGVINWALNIIFAFFSNKMRIEDEDYGYVMKNSAGNLDSINVNLGLMDNIYHTENYRTYCKDVIKNIFTFYFLKNIKTFQSSNDFMQSIYLQKSEIHLDDDFVIVNDEDAKLLSEFYFNDVCYFIWSNLGCPKIPNFGKDVLFSTGSLYTIEILQKYLKKSQFDIRNLLSSYIIFIKEVFKMKKLNFPDEDMIKKEGEILEGKLQDEISDNFNREINKRRKVKKINYLQDSLSQEQIDINVMNKENKLVEDINFFNSAHSFFHNYKKKQTNPELDKFRQLLDYAFNVKY